jgi:pyruvate/2-oxoglutarate dehydrogenase complex dihydrolipoamide dehydrogenase (E3) component
MTESEAQAQGVPYRVTRMPMAIVLRTHTLSQTRGFMKALIGADDRLLGFTALGAEASELMAVAQTAILGGIPYKVLRDTIWTRPTAAEGLLGLFANPPAAPAP